MKQLAEITNPVQRAIVASGRLFGEERDSIRRKLAVSFLVFRSGERCEDNWRAMVDALNIACALAELGICSDEPSKERIAKGEAVLAAVATRKAAGGSWTLYPQEIRELDDALWLYGVQLDYCSRGEFEKAQKIVKDRVSQALAGNAPRGVTVIKGPK